MSRQEVRDNSSTRGVTGPWLRPLAIAPVQTRGAVCASPSAPGCAWQRRCAALQVESGAVPEGERRTGAGLTPFLPASRSSRTAARPLRATDPGVESFKSSKGPAQPAFLDILPFPPSAPSPCSLQSLLQGADAFTLALLRFSPNEHEESICPLHPQTEEAYLCSKQPLFLVCRQARGV